MQLDEFFYYKNQLMQDLLTNEQIIMLLSGSGQEKSEPNSLAYSQVFPYEYIPDTITHGQTYICFDVDIQRAPSKTFLSPTIYIWVFTHKSLMRLPEGGVRVDKLCSEIAKTINGSRYYGLGELDLDSTRRFAPIADYHGKVLTFKATEFNRFTPSGRSAPSNRRGG